MKLSPTVHLPSPVIHRRGAVLRHGALFLLLGLLLVTLRAPTLFLSIGRDAGVFAYYGERILAGAVLYRDLWDHKPPVVHYLDALLFSLFGSSVLTLSLFEIVWILLGGVLAYLAAREAFPRGLPFLSALLWTLSFGTLRIVENVGMTETLAAVPATAAILGTLRWFRRPARRTLLSVGAFLGITLWTRVVAFAVALPVLLGILGGRRGLNFHQRARDVLVLALGVALPTALILSFFAARGALPDLRAQLFTYNVLYGNATGLSESLRQLPSRLRTSPLGDQPALLLLAVAGSGSLLASLAPARRKGEPDRTMRRAVTALLITSWALVDTAAAAAGGRYYTHYFAQLIPSLAVLAGGVAAGGWWWRSRLSGFLLTAILLLFLSRTTAVRADLRAGFTALRALVVTRAPPERAVRFDPQTAAAISWIEENTRSEDLLYIWGQESEIHFVTKRQSPTKFSYLYPFLVPGYAGEQDRAVLLDDLRARPPRFILDTSATNPAIPSLATGESREHGDLFAASLADPLRAYLRERYVLHATVGHWPIYRRR